MKNLRGKRALVTGAGNPRGIGFCIAELLGKAGCELILTDVTAGPVEETAARVRASGVTCSTQALDVTDFDAIRAVRDEVHAQGGPIQILVNNAGVVFGGAFLDVPLEKHILTYRVNIEGLVAVTHAFLPDLIAAPEAHLVNIASMSSFVAVPMGSTYGSSKWAVLGFTHSMRQELAALGIKHVGTTAVCPGFVDTGMFAGAKAPLLTKFLTPEDVAAKTFNAVQQNRALVLEPWLTKVSPALVALLPVPLADRISKLFGGDHAMSAWHGHR